MLMRTAHCPHTRCMSIGSLQAILLEIRQVHGLKLQLCLLVSLWIICVKTNNFKLFKMQNAKISNSHEYESSTDAFGRSN